MLVETCCHLLGSPAPFPSAASPGGCCSLKSQIPHSRTFPAPPPAQEPPAAAAPRQEPSASRKQGCCLCLPDNACGQTHCPAKANKACGTVTGHQLSTPSALLGCAGLRSHPDSLPQGSSACTRCLSLHLIFKGWHQTSALLRTGCSPFPMDKFGEEGTVVKMPGNHPNAECSCGTGTASWAFLPEGLSRCKRGHERLWSREGCR